MKFLIADESRSILSIMRAIWKTYPRHDYPNSQNSKSGWEKKAKLFAKNLGIDDRTKHYSGRFIFVTLKDCKATLSTDS